MIFLLAFVVPMVIGFWAQHRVKSTFAKNLEVPVANGMTGAQIARRILDANGLNEVPIEETPGTLSDHYDPRNRSVHLSPEVYRGVSVASTAVGAHEVGHAIQHAAGYAPLKFRSAWVPVANLGGGLSMVVLILAAVMGGAATAMGQNVATIGVILFATTTVFTLVTLPVEFDASRRALLALESGGYVSSAELQGARKVLNAAALTYVAAFVTSLLTLLYWAYRLGLLGGGRRD